MTISDYPDYVRAISFCDYSGQLFSVCDNGVVYSFDMNSYTKVQTLPEQVTDFSDPPSPSQPNLQRRMLIGKLIPTNCAPALT